MRRRAEERRLTQLIAHRNAGANYLQVGLRALEWMRFASLCIAFPRLSAQWLEDAEPVYDTVKNRLDYRCGGSAGIVET